MVNGGLRMTDGAVLCLQLMARASFLLSSWCTVAAISLRLSYETEAQIIPIDLIKTARR